MNAHKRRGIERYELQGIINERYDPNGFGRFLDLLSYMRGERQYIARSRKKKLRELIGPPEFDGPLHEGREFVGEIMCGRVFNGVTMLHYHCIRGMDDGYYRESVHRLFRVMQDAKKYKPIPFIDRVHS